MTSIVVLGRFTAERDGQLLDLGSRKQRLLLAVLLTRAGETVAADTLVEALWGSAPPASARQNVRSYAHRLRRGLGEALRSAGRQGYRLVTDGLSVDAVRFTQLVDAGTALVDTDPADARRRLHGALGLWHGEPFADLADEPALASEVTRLTECRLTALHRRIDLDLLLGHPDAVVAELRRLTAQHPYREDFRAQLMLALYRSGRQAEALEAYRAARTVLSRELGLEPGPDLRRLEHAILRRDPALDRPAGDGAGVGPAGGRDGDRSGGDRARHGPAGDRAAGSAGLARTAPLAPATLPPAVAYFTGRGEELVALDAFTTGPAGEAAAGPVRGPAVAVPGPAVSVPVAAVSVPVAAVVGSAGVGKTALAVHWAHRAAHRYPDGQIFLDLRGFSPNRPLRPIEALARLLSALGDEPGQIPAELDDAVARYRSLLAGRRVMVVLDNARDAAQVRPLLPGDPGCVVVVTSRQRMPGLVAHAAARQLVLDPLPDGPAIELLARILPRERVAGEPEAAAALAKVCGNLPLALCIAAANLAEQPEHSLADRVAQLASASRLAALRIDGDDGPAPQAMFDLSYATLDATQQRVFRRLGVVPGPHVTPGVAAVLADVAVRTAGSCLDRLADIHLVQRQGSDRFALHDLLREYAALRATAEDGAGTGSTVDRLYRYYVEASHAAAQALYPQVLRLDIGPSAVGVDGAVPAFADQAAATAWLGTELPNLLAAAADAARRGHPAAWLIPDALRNYFWHRRNVIDWRATAHAAADAADAVGDDRARAAAQFSLGHLAICVRDHETSAAHYAEALEASRRAAWAEAEASVLGNLAAVHAEAGRLNTAAGMFEQALALHRTTGSRYREAVTLGNLGLLRASLGELRQAADLIGQALDLHRAHGSTATEAIVRTNLADVQIDLGLLDEAGANAATALELARRVGRIDAEIMALLYLSAVHREQGDTARALTRVEQAWPLLDSVGDPEIEAKVHTALAAARHSAGDIMQAIHHYDRAVRLTTDNRHGVIAVRALIGLAAAHRDLGDTPAARTYAEQAASIARAAGYRRLEDRARVYLPQRVR